MYGITDLTKGRLIEYNTEPYIVISSVHSKLGRGGGMQRVKMKNLITGTILDVTFKGSDKILPAKVETKDAQYLYREGESYYFMDTKSYEQFVLTSNELDQAINYLKEGENYAIDYYRAKPIKVELPIKMTLKIAQADVGLKGDSANSASKVVTTETGLKITVPLFINQSDRVIVDTRDGSYAGRAQ